jgi:hypothetical protein
MVAITGFAQEEIPRSFRNFSLGMGVEELKTVLANDEIFRFREDRDVSFLPLREEVLIETTGNSFVRQAFFQLRGQTVFIMTFRLNTQLVDHYSVFMSFIKKYGEPLTIDPKQAVWESETTRVAIERPLTVKYIDRVIFDAIVDESQLHASERAQMFEDFLNDF